MTVKGFNKEGKIEEKTYQAVQPKSKMYYALKKIREKEMS